MTDSTTLTARFGTFDEMAQATLASQQVQNLVALIQEKLPPVLQAEGLQPAAWSRVQTHPLSLGFVLGAALSVSDPLTASTFYVDIRLSFERTPVQVDLVFTVVGRHRDAMASPCAKLPMLCKDWERDAELGQTYREAVQALADHGMTLDEQAFRKMAADLSVALMP